MQNIEKLSVVIITHNEERNIARCIKSVLPLADEIIVLDSFSKDRTVSIAKSYNARVWQEEFRGYIQQKNRAVSLASNDLILSLDADEVIDETLCEAIQKVKKTFIFGAYRMKRCTNICGKFIRKGTWYPDRKIRLFDRRHASWGGLNPHDKILLKKNMAVKQLPGEILHFSFPTLEAYITQNERFSSMVAGSYFEAGKRTNLFRLFFNPVWTFFFGFVLRGGFLEGTLGFIIAYNQSRYTFLKHSKLYGLQTGRSKINTSDVQSTTDTNCLAGNI